MADHLEEWLEEAALELLEEEMVHQEQNVNTARKNLHIDTSDQNEAIIDQVEDILGVAHQSPRARRRGNSAFTFDDLVQTPRARCERAWSEPQELEGFARFLFEQMSARSRRCTLSRKEFLLLNHSLVGQAKCPIEPNDGTNCVICICEFEKRDEVTMLPCRHVFHKVCLGKWVTEEAGTCPCCRTPIGKREHPYFPNEFFETLHEVNTSLFRDLAEGNLRMDSFAHIVEATAQRTEQVIRNRAERQRREQTMERNKALIRDILCDLTGSSVTLLKMLMGKLGGDPGKYMDRSELLSDLQELILDALQHRKRAQRVHISGQQDKIAEEIHRWSVKTLKLVSTLICPAIKVFEKRELCNAIAKELVN